MTSHYKVASLTLVAAAISLATALPAQAANTGDTFNRASLGATWKTVSPSISISADQFVGSQLGLGYLKAAKASNAASAVVYLNSTDLEYGAVAVGNVAAGTNAFVKIQAQNGAGTFDHAGFYTGNNVGGSFISLTSPVPSPATIDVAFTGTVAYLRITSAAGVQTYSYDYGTTFGKGGGLGTYGSVSLDNFEAYTGTGATLASTGKVIRVLPGTHQDRDLSK
jgi:hypothetical protein